MKKRKSEKGGSPENRLEQVAVDRCMTLRRNPQYLTRRQMDSLKRSIQREGFVVPILVRPVNDKYEIVSGNHRFMAAVELGHTEVPAVVADLTSKQAQRLAVNLNLIHGDPTAALLAPFLAEMDEDVLADVHIEDGLLAELKSFDETLAKHLTELAVPEGVTSNSSPKTNTMTCRCPTCGKTHIATAPEDSE